MAIKKSVTTAYGIDVSDAYHRVESVVLLEKTAISYNLRSYKDASGLPFFAERYITSGYDINGDNPLAQAYAYVKTLPEFSCAVDC